MDDKGLIRGGAVACFGAAMVLLGLDIIPQHVFEEPGEPLAPSWMLVVIGLVLIPVGVSPFFRTGSPIATRLVGVSCLLMALPFFWVAFFVDHRQPSGDNSFLRYFSFFFPYYAVVLFNSVLFKIFLWCLGGLLWMWVGVMALRHAKHQPDEGVVDSDL